jgi:hypothetical protein
MLGLTKEECLKRCEGLEFKDWGMDHEKSVFERIFPGKTYKEFCREEREERWENLTPKSPYKLSDFYVEKNKPHIQQVHEINAMVNQLVNDNIQKTISGLGFEATSDYVTCSGIFQRRFTDADLKKFWLRSFPLITCDPVEYDKINSFVYSSELTPAQLSLQKITAQLRTAYHKAALVKRKEEKATEKARKEEEKARKQAEKERKQAEKANKKVKVST